MAEAITCVLSTVAMVTVMAGFMYLRSYMVVCTTIKLLKTEVLIYYLLPRVILYVVLS